MKRDAAFELMEIANTICEMKSMELGIEIGEYKATLNGEYTVQDIMN